MKEKVYVIVGICEGDNEPTFLAMGQKKAYRNLKDAKEELKRIEKEVKDNEYDYKATWSNNDTMLAIHFENSHEEAYYIYKMEVI